MPWEELGKSKVSIAQDITSGENVALSSIADTDGKNVLRIVDAAPFAYDEINLANRITPALKDISARATDDIIKTIGLENIKMFLKMDDNTNNVVCDFINRDLKFDINGNPLLQQGPFGKCMSFNGDTDYLIQQAKTFNNGVPRSEAVLTSSSKLATRLNAINIVPNMARIRIKCVGALPSASVKLSVYTDVFDKPGSLVVNSESDILACSEMEAVGRAWGFVFPNAFNLTANKKYWLVLEYADNTGVDAENYITWEYSTDNSYAERRAVYDSGESDWVVTNAENHIFYLYNDDLKMSDDFSIITVVKNTDLTTTSRYILGTALSDGTTLFMSKYLGHYRICAIKNIMAINQVNEFVVLAVTFNKALAEGKVNGYINGRLLASVDGDAETTISPSVQPLVIGSGIFPNGAIAAGGVMWEGYIGPVIITSSALTQSQIGEVTRSLLCLRNAGVGV